MLLRAGVGANAGNNEIHFGRVCNFNSCRGEQQPGLLLRGTPIGRALHVGDGFITRNSENGNQHLIGEGAGWRDVLIRQLDVGVGHMVTHDVLDHHHEVNGLGIGNRERSCIHGAVGGGVRRGVVNEGQRAGLTVGLDGQISTK